MAKKLEIIGNAIVASDTLTGNVEYEWPARDIYFIARDLENGKIRLYDTNNVNAHGSEVWENDLSDTVDGSDVTFTISSFRNFGRTSLGKSSDGSSGGAVNSVTGDGVGGTPADVIMSFPDADEVDDSTTTNKFFRGLSINLDGNLPNITRTFQNNRTTWQVQHDFDSDVAVTVFRNSNGRTVNLREDRIDSNNVAVSRTNNISDNFYKILIISMR